MGPDDEDIFDDYDFEDDLMDDSIDEEEIDDFDMEDQVGDSIFDDDLDLDLDD